MPVRDDDWLMREVERLGAAASKMLAGALGRDQAEAPTPEIVAGVEGLLDELDHARLDRADPASVVGMLRRDRLRAYVAALRLSAQWCEDAEEAEHRLRRADALEAAAGA